MRRTADTQDLTALVQRALGPATQVTGVDRLRGGTKKGVYRVHLEQAPQKSVIIYSWADDENFWPDAASKDDGVVAGTAAAHDPRDPFAPASGYARYLAAQQTLEGLGIRACRVYLADDTRQQYPADVAVVEDLPGGNLEALYDTDPALAEAATKDLAHALKLMHTHRAPTYGTLEQVAHHSEVLGTSCEQVILDRALADLDEGARRDPRLGVAKTRLREHLLDLRGRIRPRQEHALIHGELGPDHVLVTPDPPKAVLIDIEGLLFFDVEWEHVFLELRFHEHYRLLAENTHLDQQRLDLYRLGIRLALVAGPLRLLDGDFPDRAFMQQIVEGNLQAALALLPEETTHA